MRRCSISCVAGAIVVPLIASASLGHTPTLAPSAPSPRPAPTRYLEIPIRGRLGRDILPAGIAAALDDARRRKIAHIVFTIDSDGGDLWAAHEALDLLRRRDAEFDYIGVITNARSAALAVVAPCDRLFIAPGALLGADLAEFHDPGSADGRCDPGQLAAFGASLAAAAEAKGRDPLLFRAMVQADLEVVRWTDPDTGVLKVAGARPPSPPSGEAAAFDELDGPSSVLALTSNQAIDLGLAEPDPGSLSALGPVLNAPGWSGAGTRGTRALTESSTRQQRLLDGTQEAIDGIGATYKMAQAQAAVAARATSERRSPRRNYQAGGYYNNSLHAYQRATRDAIAQWEYVLDGLERIVRHRKVARQNIKALHPSLQTGFTRSLDEAERVDAGGLRVRAKGEIDRLRRDLHDAR